MEIGEKPFRCRLRVEPRVDAFVLLAKLSQFPRPKWVGHGFISKMDINYIPFGSQT